MYWLSLVIAGAFEVLGVISMNRIIRKRSLVNVLMMIVAFTGSFSCLTIAMNGISMGTAYAVWTGIGTVGGALVGMLMYNEARSGLRILFIAMIITSAVGLKLIA
ncbi:multidrug efflux SMR transporter [Paenibacillus campi]|uniref:DMT family transporter n=1 Tax=Paenibacillus campi TaxID=3106031 RepID=UPI002AFE3F10|nr:multidrug efflux SMR transporter [Paenibacillus sp. SGZ-1009]